MKKFQLIALVLLTFIFFNSCFENTNNPKTGNENCDYSIDSRLAFLYECPPSVDNCYEGIITNEEKFKALDRLNYLRAIHGLPKVSYNPAQDEAVQKSALLGVANETITHYPDSSFKCFTTKGDTACKQSNLHLSYNSSFNKVWTAKESIDGWVNERYSKSLGHRRWFLSPFLKSVAFGRVDQIKSDGKYWISSTMWVWDSDGSTNANIDFVACPFHDYPSTAFDTDLYLSFSVLMNKSNWISNDSVNFSSSTIQVKDESQKSYIVQNISYDNEYYGLPNHIQWKVGDLKRNEKYNVTISNVNVNGTIKNYDYWFKIVN